MEVNKQGSEPAERQRLIMDTADRPIDVKASKGEMKVECRRGWKMAWFQITYQKYHLKMLV